MSERLTKSVASPVTKKAEGTNRIAGNDLKWGLTDEDLATRETVYRNDLFSGQVVLISGGGTGMGKAMAFLYARLGADVMICGRRQEKLKETQAAIKKHVGKDIVIYPMSIRNVSEVDLLIQSVFENFGRLDILINNAGGQFPQDAIDFSTRGWQSVVDLNLNGTWYMMQAAAKTWRDRKEQGSIINIVANVERGMPQAAHTCAARAGVIYLSKTVATEWAPFNIRVNCIAPGIIATEGFNVYPEEAVTKFSQANPMRAIGSAWDVAEGAIYLSGPTGNFITGDLLVIDGGQSQFGVAWPAGMPEYFKRQE